MKRFNYILTLFVTMVMTAPVFSQHAAGIDSLRIGKLLRLSNGSFMEVHGSDITDFFTRLDAAARLDSSNVINGGLGIEDFSEAARAYFGGLGSGMYPPDGSALTWYILPPDTFVTIADGGVQGRHLAQSAKDTVSEVIDRNPPAWLANVGSGIVGNGYWFDGGNEIVVPDDPSVDISVNGASVEMVFRINDLSSNNGLLGRYGNLSNRLGVYVLSNGLLSLINKVAGVSKYLYTPAGIVEEGKLYHMVISIDSSATNAIYLNGERQPLSANDISDQELYASADWYIGNWSNVDYLNGECSLVRLWTTPLTNDEVRELFESGQIQNKHVMADNTDIMAGWDFASGWSATAATTINDQNTFTTTATGGIYDNTITDLEIGKEYRLVIDGTASAGVFSVWSNATGAPPVYGTGFGTHIFTAVTTGLYLRISAAATVDIAGFTLTRTGNTLHLAADKTTGEWHDSYGRATATVHGATLINAPARTLTTMVEPEADAALVQHDIVEGGTASTVFEVQAEGDATLSGSEAGLKISVVSDLSSPPGALTFSKETTSPAANDQIGDVKYSSKNSTGDDVLYAYNRGLILDPTAASEDGAWKVSVSQNSSTVEMIRATGKDPISNDAEVVINNDGNIFTNFRVKTYDAHTGFGVDGLTSEVSVGYDNADNGKLFSVNDGWTWSGVDPGGTWSNSSSRALKENIELDPITPEAFKKARRKRYNFKKGTFIEAYPYDQRRAELTEAALIESLTDQQRQTLGQVVVVDSLPVYNTVPRIQPDSTIAIDTVSVSWKPIWQFRFNPGEEEKLRASILVKEQLAWDKAQDKKATKAAAKVWHFFLAEEMGEATCGDSTRREINTGDVMSANWDMTVQLLGRVEALEAGIDLMIGVLTAFGVAGLGVAARKKKTTT